MLEASCIVCKSMFTYYPSNKSGKFCGQKCSRIGQIRAGATKKGIYITCIICNNTAYKHPSTATEKCCSKKCSNKLISEMYKNDQQRKDQLVEARKDRDFTNPDLLKKRSEISKRLYSEGIIKKRLGADNNLWKGGIATAQNKARATPEYKAWRKAVYERDGYKCIKCGTHAELHAHHIKTFSKFPDLRYDLDNGITVCRQHHGEIHGRELPNIGLVRYKMKLLNKETL